MCECLSSQRSKLCTFVPPVCVSMVPCLSSLNCSYLFIFRCYICRTVLEVSKNKHITHTLWKLWPCDIDCSVQYLWTMINNLTLIPSVRAANGVAAHIYSQTLFVTWYQQLIIINVTMILMAVQLLIPWCNWMVNRNHVLTLYNCLTMRTLITFSLMRGNWLRHAHYQSSLNKFNWCPKQSVHVGFYDENTYTALHFCFEMMSLKRLIDQGHCTTQIAATLTTDAYSCSFLHSTLQLLSLFYNWPVWVASCLWCEECVHR